jgi:hypothetical protein
MRLRCLSRIAKFEPCRCIPPVGSVSSFDTEDGWKLVFRQILPSTDRENGGYFLPGELSRNPDDESASMYSVLNQLEQMRGSDHMCAPAQAQC